MFHQLVLYYSYTNEPEAYPPRKSYDECLEDLCLELELRFQHDKEEFDTFICSDLQSRGVPDDTFHWWFQNMEKNHDTYINKKYRKNKLILEKLFSSLQENSEEDFTYHIYNWKQKK